MIDIYHFIELPLRLNYTSKGEGIRFYASAGVAPRIFFRDRTTTEIQRASGQMDKQTGANEVFDYKRLQIGGFLSSGIAFQLSEKTTFFAGPRIQLHRFAGESEQLDHSFTSDFMQLGLDVGVRFY